MQNYILSRTPGGSLAMNFQVRFFFFSPKVLICATEISACCPGEWNVLCAASRNEKFHWEPHWFILTQRRASQCQWKVRMAGRRGNTDLNFNRAKHLITNIKLPTCCLRSWSWFCGLSDTRTCYKLTHRGGEENTRLVTCIETFCQH